tara:strand:- start:1009 stop:1290 length:282 start_codon:yes stop_codon:yes gene_type:complete
VKFFHYAVLKKLEPINNQRALVFTLSQNHKITKSQKNIVSLFHCFFLSARAVFISGANKPAQRLDISTDFSANSKLPELQSNYDIYFFDFSTL